MKNKAKNVFVWGTFDILHKGHYEFFTVAKSFGNKLYAIVLPDERLADHKKGKTQEENERRRNLLNLPFLDDVFIDSLPNLSCFFIHNPDIFCLGYDQKTEWEDKLCSFLQNNFPSCKIIRLPEFAGGIHSSDLRKENTKEKE